MNRIRVRFAPSPTGALHIGGVRTVLYNYLFAKKHKGVFILRIEDTDQSRFVEGAEQYIRESLNWLGIIPDEGIEEGGAFGPYKQSERKDHYIKYALQLIDDGKAYYAFDTPEELEAMRQRMKETGEANPVYNFATRGEMKNSLTLSGEDVQARLSSGFPYVIRLLVPSDEEVQLVDIVRGEVRVHSSNIDDKILVKSDGLPTYHLANVVDDHLMEITHVIRGEEWLPSAPLHVLLYRFLGWEDDMPRFAHLPLLLKPDGNGKLSKRSADKLGIPIFPLDWTDPKTAEVSKGFREEGYLPEALVNFLALLGWNPGTERELFDMEALISEFSLEKIGKSGARFDIEKAKWFNQQYLKEKENTELAGDFLTDIQNAGFKCSGEKAEAICGLLKERVIFPKEILEQGIYFFEPPTSYDEKVVRKKWNDEAITVLSGFVQELGELDNFNRETVVEALNRILEKENIKMGRIMQALRLAVTGVGSGPDLMEIMVVLGREEVIERINNALTKIEGHGQ